MGIRDALLKTKTLATESVNVPSVGDVVVQALKAGEFLALRESCMLRGKKGRVRFDSHKFQLLLVAKCVVENGQRAFSDDDVSQIEEMSIQAVEKIATVAAKLCGISQDEDDDLGEASPAPAATGDSSLT